MVFSYIFYKVFVYLTIRHTIQKIKKLIHILTTMPLIRMDCKYYNFTLEYKIDHKLLNKNSYKKLFKNPRTHISI